MPVIENAMKRKLEAGGLAIAINLVFPRLVSAGAIDGALQRKLDRFAAQWLKNLADQGHRLDGNERV